MQFKGAFASYLRGIETVLPHGRGRLVFDENEGIITAVQT
ncbi:hypothetical protein JOC94_002504 [Bacillus thermophilus]|uniref:Uncharacterized protein n=1 Tax=Siminovitchia thermophila TaxID=1245522 RepID=A0ABS2RA68_9BACI|nr:hypothetical protein [Siminovitchia thermophila]